MSDDVNVENSLKPLHSFPIGQFLPAFIAGSL